MRVLHLVNNVDWVGGIETYLFNLIPELHRLGVKLGIGHFKRNTRLKLPADYIYLCQNTLENVLKIKKWKPDLVHVHNIFDKFLLDKILEKLPAIFTTHGYQIICPAQDFYLERPRDICKLAASWRCFPVTLAKKCMSMRPYYAFNSYLLTKWAKKNRLKIRMLICPSRYAAERHIQAGFDENIISVLPYFCSLKPLKEIRPIPSLPTITFLGRTTQYKGIDLFIRILSELRHGIRGIIAGNITEQLKEFVNKNQKLKDRLILREWVSRDGIKDLFKETSVFVFPSIWPETLGIVGIEALSAGVPVVAFDVGGVREWLIDGENGFLIKRKDVIGAANAINTILNDQKIMKNMGEYGLRLIQEKFSIVEHSNKLLQIYCNVIR